VKHNKNFRDNLISITLFVTLATAFYFIYWPKIVADYQADWQPVQAPLAIAELSPQIELITEYKNTNVKQIELKEGVAYIGGSLNVKDLVALISFDPLTQKTNWQVRPSSQIITIDSNRVYIWGDAGEVIAYDKITGMKVWQEVVDRRFPIIDALTITPFGLLVESRNPSGTRYHLVNLETGRKISSFQTEAEKNDFWLENALPVTTADVHNNITTQGDIEWQNSVDFKPYAGSRTDIQFILTDDNIVAYKESNSITEISALNRISGNVLWEVEVNSMSNLTVAEDILFFVTENGELTGVDINSGQITTYVTFSTAIQEELGHNGNVIIAADSSLILMYIYSSKQLFIFRWVDN
jgi:outer membrane protein assembly factor BamB